MDKTPSVKNLKESFGKIDNFWDPAIAGEVNNHHVKLAKFHDEFIWHKHDHEDEMFLVVKGSITIHLRDSIKTIKEGEFIIVPKGVEHKPAADDEAWVMLFEPKETVNTGNQETSDKTKKTLKRL